MNTVTVEDPSSLRTRPGLLRQLAADDDASGWQEFYRVYGGLIRSFALKAGLNPSEAEEVVQETAIGVARRMPEFRYDPKVCRFKTWLLNLVRWRIQDQIRRRPLPVRHGGEMKSLSVSGASDSAGDDGGLRPGEALMDPVVPEFGAEWDREWEAQLMRRALEVVRERIEERQFQMFDLSVLKGRPAREVARTLGVGVASVYLAKHRVTAMLKREVARLETPDSTPA